MEFTERVAREMAQGWETGLELGKEKGSAPIMIDTFEDAANAGPTPGDGERRV